VAGISPLPEVMDSSTRMACSGINAPMAAEIPVRVICPVGTGGRSVRG